MLCILYIYFTYQITCYLFLPALGITVSGQNPSGQKPIGQYPSGQNPRKTKGQGDNPPQGQKPRVDNIPGYRIPGGQHPKICVFVFVLGTRVPVSTVGASRA